MPKIGPSKFWTPDRLDVIRRHAKTHSASEIAAFFEGVSRNAIIGVASREGIKLEKGRVYHPPRAKRHRVKQEATMGSKDSGSSDPKHKRPTPQQKQPRPVIATPATFAEQQAFDAAPERLPHQVFSFEEHGPGEFTLWNMRDSGQCRWPTGHNGRLTLYCGAPTENTYCAFHTRVRSGQASETPRVGP